MILFIFLGKFSLFGQNPTSLLKDSVNLLYLENLVKEKIDNVRATKGLNPLANDTFLYQAANHHAQYLTSQRRLSHFEERNSKFYSPQNRVNMFGAPATYLAGENLVQISKFKKSGNKLTSYHSYSSAANLAVKLWLNSKGHYENIVNADYDITGLAIKENNNNFIIVQKFADVLYKYKFSEPTNSFPYSNYKSSQKTSSFLNIKQEMHLGNHAWSVESMKDSATYSQLNKIVNNDDKILKIQPKGRNIYVLTSGSSHLANLIKRRNDGLAIELMRYNEYHCGNPEYYTSQSRRNFQCEFSGQLLQPKFKKELKGKIEYPFKTKFKKLKSKHNFFNAVRLSFDTQPKDFFKYKLGKIPKDEYDYLEFNLVYLKDKKVYRVRHLSDICGDPIISELPAFFHNYPSDTLEYTPPIKDTTLTYFFPKSSAQIDATKISPESWTSFSHYKIDSILIHAFASIEGSPIVNNTLLKRRSEKVIQLLQSEQSSRIESKVETQLNWPLFKKQIERNRKLSIFKNLQKAQIKKLVDSIALADNKKLDQYLDSQRYASIHIKTNYDFKNHKLPFLRQQFNLLVDSAINSSNKNIALLLSIKIETLLSNAFNYCILNDSSQFSYFKPPESELFPNCLAKYYYLGQKLGITVPQNRWEKIYTLYSDPFSVPHIYRYNYLLEKLIDLSSDSSLFIRKLDEFIKTASSIKAMESSSLSKKIDSMQLFIFQNILNYNKSIKDEELIQLASNEVFNYFNNPSRSENEILNAAKLFVHIENHNNAYQLLNPRINLNNSSDASLIYFSKLIYQHPNEYPNSGYVPWLIELKKQLPKNKWCDMFIGKCNISFQVFDDKHLRDTYCDYCDFENNYVIKNLSK